jgi:hypothetical protein
MRLNVGGLLGVVCVAVALSGCGGGGGGARNGSSHTYVLAAPANNAAGSGIYVTIVSPVAIPASLLTKNGARIVGQARGQQACPITKTGHGGHGEFAFLNGKTLTVKISGSNPSLSMICAVLKKTPFNPSQIGGA